MDVRLASRKHWPVFFSSAFYPMDTDTHAHANDAVDTAIWRHREMQHQTWPRHSFAKRERELRANGEELLQIDDYGEKIDAKEAKAIAALAFAYTKSSECIQRLGRGAA